MSLKFIAECAQQYVYRHSPRYAHLPDGSTYGWTMESGHMEYLWHSRSRLLRLPDITGRDCQLWTACRGLFEDRYRSLTSFP